MNAHPQAKLAMRPMLAEDVPLLAEIFRAAIEELTGDDYSEAQQEAWAETADDLETFGAKLAGELTLVATHDGAAIGFASLADECAHRHAVCASGRCRAGGGRDADRRDGETRGRAGRQRIRVSRLATPRATSSKGAASRRRAATPCFTPASGWPTPR